MSDAPRVLLVDDERAVLDAIRRHLRTRFEVDTATSGMEGLAQIAKAPPAIVVSDYQMPGMNGAAFLREVRNCSPNTIRILLTGHADLQGAAAVVNQGAVFRFLLKPIPTQDLIAALDAAVEQHRLVRAEQELLEHTLTGAIDAMTDLLSIACPTAFARATRMRTLASLLFDAAGLQEPWHVGVAATLSQVGAIAVPPSVLDRINGGAAVSAEEAAMVERMPLVADQVLARIPRLDLVRECIAKQDCDDTAPIGARALRIVRDYDVLETSGKAAGDALATMERRGVYDPALLHALGAGLAARAAQPTRLIARAQLEVGMTLAEDVMTNSGTKLVPRGHVVTANLLERISNFARVAPGIVEPIHVFAGSKSTQGAA